MIENKTPVPPQTLPPQTEQLVGMFACQTAFLTVGKPDGFSTLDDYYRFGSQECGFEVVSVPLDTMLFDLKLATQSKGYVSDLDGHLQNLGYKGGLGGVEFHPVGQNVDLPASRVGHFGRFIDPDNYLSMSAGSLEDKAANIMMQLIDVAAKHPKIKRLRGFFGGKAWATGQAKWPAWPKFFSEWAIASHVNKWEPRLEYAGFNGVTVAPELGHPENTLLTGENFVMFWKLLSENGRKGLGLHVDMSHFQNIGVNPMPHFKRALQGTGVPLSNHYKSGALIERFDGTCTTYGGWQPWSKASGSFYTVGIIGNEDTVREFHNMNTEQHLIQEGGNHIFCEGECVILEHPKQGMKVGAHNGRALRAGKDLMRVEGVVGTIIEGPREQGAYPQNPLTILTPEGTYEEIAPWAGGPFDSVFYSPRKAYEVLGLSDAEIAATRLILEQGGYTEAASI